MHRRGLPLLLIPIVILAAGATGQAGRVRPVIAFADEFASLEDDPSFRHLVDERMKPCRDAVYRQFDFWIGEWDVASPKGRPALGRDPFAQAVRGMHTPFGIDEARTPGGAASMRPSSGRGAWRSVARGARAGAILFAVPAICLGLLVFLLARGYLAEGSLGRGILLVGIVTAVVDAIGIIVGAGLGFLIWLLGERRRPQRAFPV